MRGSTFQTKIRTMTVRKRTDGFDWDGLRYFQAVASLGTLTEAARRLRVRHTTVARQLDRLEDSLGSRLFLRNPRGYVLTPVGETLLESVEAIAARVNDVARLAAGGDVEVQGVVRVATADVLASHVLLPALRPLLASAPGLDVSVVSDTRTYDLTRREADLALRLGATSEPHLVAKKIAKIGFGLYAAPGGAKTRDVAEARYVTFDESVGRQPHDEWIASHAPRARVALRANRQHTLLEAVRLGLGLGILPCLAADGDPSLARILGPSDVFVRELYLVVHRDGGRARRVRAVYGAVEEYVGAHRDRLLGA